MEEKRNKTKFNVKKFIVILFVLQTIMYIVFMFDMADFFLMREETVQKEYSKEILQEAERILDFNAGDITSDLSEEQRTKAIHLVAEIQEHIETRTAEGDLTFGSREKSLRKKLNDLLDNQTVESLEAEYDEEEGEMNGEDDLFVSLRDILGSMDGEEEIKNNNHTWIYANLKNHMSRKDFLNWKKAVRTYMHTQEQEDYDKIAEHFSDYPELNGNLLFLLFHQYGKDRTEAVYQVDENLELQEEILFPNKKKEENGFFHSLFAAKKNFPKEETVQFSEKNREYIWNMVKNVIKPENLQKFDYVVVTTDGKDNTMASVIESPDGDGTGERWLLQVDHADMEDDFVGTIVHEYGHYLTLNEKQVQYTDEYDLSCYCEDGMVANENSVINRFYKTFWKDYLLNDSDTSYEFYLRNQDCFVSDYAATNPDEDIAETFRVFVMEDKPKRDRVRDKKVRFFYEQEGFVQLRKEIRQSLHMK